MNNPRDEFDSIVNNEFIDTTPYGIQKQPAKPGLTPRGKVALAIGAAAIVTSGLVGWQMYSANQAASEAKAQEIAYKQDQLELEKLKVLNETSKAQTSTDSARQKQIDACVKGNKDLVGKTLSSTYRDIVDACQAQYTTSSSTADMQPAASSQNSGGGANSGLLIGGGVLAGGIVLVARKGTRSNQA
jgi:hypothetical protein